MAQVICSVARFFSLHSRLGIVPHGWDETKDSEEGNLLSVGLALVYHLFLPYTTFCYDLFSSTFCFGQKIVYMLVVGMVFSLPIRLDVTRAKYPWHMTAGGLVFLLAGWLSDFDMTVAFSVPRVGRGEKSYGEAISCLDLRWHSHDWM